MIWTTYLLPSDLPRGCSSKGIKTPESRDKNQWHLPGAFPLQRRQSSCWIIVLQKKLLKLYCPALKRWHTKIKEMEKESPQLEFTVLLWTKISGFPTLREKGLSFYYSLSSLCLTWDTHARRKFQLLLEKWERILRARSWRACWDPNGSEHHPVRKRRTEQCA